LGNIKKKEACNEAKMVNILEHSGLKQGERQLSQLTILPSFSNIAPMQATAVLQK
jgi:hypothetical protein